MIVDSLAAIAPVPARAVIINCSTKLVSTLALLSALRFANIPVLLIDCESTDGSWVWFSQLMQSYRFDMLSMPLRPHGKTLDILFLQTGDQSLLLLDSDLEIRDAIVMEKVSQAMLTPNAYGAGFMHYGGDMSSHGHTKVDAGRYMDRMWIPFSFLKTNDVRDAIRAGATFMHSRHYLEFPWSRYISKLLYVRHRLPWLRDISINRFRAARQRIHGEQYTFREYDTGAHIHEALARAGKHLVHLGEPYHSQSVHHYHGVTRATLTVGQSNATAPSTIADEVEHRLRTQYNICID